MRTLCALLVALLVWTAGLLAFVERAQRQTSPELPPAADGMVVLTGASTDRLTSAMHLLDQGRAKRLLVSGVNREATREDILSVTRAIKPLYDCCVDLGFAAEDTIGNARETAAWVRQKGFRSLLVVTSDYHMARSLLEIRSALPDIDLHTHAVPTPLLAGSQWWRSASAPLILLEYNKYLAVLAREGFLSLGPKDPEPPALAKGNPAS